MTLKLYVTNIGWENYEIPVRRNNAVPEVYVNDEYDEDAVVEATLEDLPAAAGKTSYRLRLGYHPDVKFDCVCVDDHGGRFPKGKMYYYERSKKKRENLEDIENGNKKVQQSQGRLFRGAMGPSVLVLEEEQKDGEFADVWRAHVVIRPKDDRLRVMQAMVAEILPINPYLALSTAWRMSKIRISKQWRSESVSALAWSALIEYEVTSWLFDTIRPHLYGIASSPADAVSHVQAVVKIKSIRRLSSSMACRICRKAVVMGALSRDAYVKGNTLSASGDIVAHRVIGDFLKARLKRLSRIEHEMKRLVEIGAAEFRDKVAGDDKREYNKLAIVEEHKIIQKIDALRQSIGACYVSGPWHGLPSGPQILSVRREAFSYGAHYQYVYAQMSAFAKMQFIWNEHSCTPALRVSRRQEVVNDKSREPNEWIHNYSVIYEGWVFIRLMRAFERLGFSMLEGYRACVVKNAIDAFMGQKHNTQFQMRSENSGLLVELCYGCSFPKKTPDSTTFCHMRDGTQTLTPDFSLLIRRVDSDKKVYALVLDAKSGRMLETRDVDARNKYEDKVWKNADEKLEQVWLIYAGESESHSHAGIEFSQSQLDGNECWNDDDRWHEDGRLENPGTKNGSFVWGREGISQKGLMKCFKRGATFVGHLRANAITDKGGAVFEEVVEGIINTAYHVLADDR